MCQQPAQQHLTALSQHLNSGQLQTQRRRQLKFFSLRQQQRLLRFQRAIMQPHRKANTCVMLRIDSDLLGEGQRERGCGYARQLTRGCGWQRGHGGGEQVVFRNLH